MEFDDFLRRRRLDVAAFRAAEPARTAEWAAWYAQLHPDSFLLQVKQILNDVRRRYHLAEAPAPSGVEGSAPRAAGRRARPIGPLTEIPVLDPAAPLADPEVLRADAGAPIEKPDPTSEKLGTPSSEFGEPSSERSRSRSVLGTSSLQPGGLGSDPEPAAPVRPLRSRAVIRRPVAPPEQGSTAGPDSPPTPTETGVWLPATTGSAVPDGVPIPPETADRLSPDVPEFTPGRPEAAEAAPPPQPPRPRPMIRRPPPEAPAP